MDANKQMIDEIIEELSSICRNLDRDWANGGGDEKILARNYYSDFIRLIKDKSKKHGVNIEN